MSRHTLRRWLWLLLAGSVACGCAARQRHPGEPAAFTCVRLDLREGSPFGIGSGDWNGDGAVDLAVSLARRGQVASFLQTAPRTFERRGEVAVGTTPRAVVARDLDGDGKTDLLIAAAESDALITLRGDGGGGFAERRQYRAGVGPFDVVVADLDADGHVDAVVANESNALLNQSQSLTSVYFGTADGQFEKALQLQSNARPASVRVADFDADGKPDLAVVGWLGRKVSILRNLGGRRFEPARDIDVQVGLPYGLDVADFDRDGHMDLAVTDIESRAVKVWHGDGKMGFERLVPVAVGAGVRFVAAVDLDADGSVDLITADTADNTVSIARGRGAEGFAPRTTIAVGRQPRTVHVADLDADGRLDLAVSNMTSDSVQLLFQSDGASQLCPAE